MEDKYLFKYIINDSSQNDSCNFAEYFLAEREISEVQIVRKYIHIKQLEQQKADNHSAG